VKWQRAYRKVLKFGPRAVGELTNYKLLPAVSEIVRDPDIPSGRLSFDPRKREACNTAEARRPGGCLVSWAKYSWVGLTLFAILSAADLLLTSALLRANVGAYESNPVAAACLEQYGWGGLALYKIGAVVAFAGAVALLIRRRPKVGAAMVTLACLILLSVTSYSHRLLMDSHRENTQLSLTEGPMERPIALSSAPDVALPDAGWISAR